VQRSVECRVVFKAVRKVVGRILMEKIVKGEDCLKRRLLRETMVFKGDKIVNELNDA